MAAQHGRDVLWSAARSHKSTCISAQHHGLPNISTIFYLNALLAEFDLQEALRQRSCPQKAADRSQRFAVGEEAKGVGSSHLAPRTSRAATTQLQPTPLQEARQSYAFRQHAQRHHWGSQVSFPTPQSPGFAESGSAEGGWIGDTTLAV